MRFIYLTILSVLFSISFTGCNPEEEKEVGKTSLDKINDWVYREMEYWYFWTDDLPGKPETNVNPYNFFNQLKVDEDRFFIFYTDFTALGKVYNVYPERNFEYNVIMTIIIEIWVEGAFKADSFKRNLE